MIGSVHQFGIQMPNFEVWLMDYEVKAINFQVTEVLSCCIHSVLRLISQHWYNNLFYALLMFTC